MGLSPTSPTVITKKNGEVQFQRPLHETKRGYGEICKQECCLVFLSIIFLPFILLGQLFIYLVLGIRGMIRNSKRTKLDKDVNHCSCSVTDDYLLYSRKSSSSVDEDNFAIVTIILEKPCKVEHIKTVMKTRLLATSDLGKKSANRLVMELISLGKEIGFGFKINEDFNINNYILHTDKLDKNCTLKDIEQYVAELITFPVDMSKVLWKMWVCESCGPEKRGILFFKYHLSISDPMALLRILYEKLADEELFGDPLKEKKTPFVKPKFGHVAFMSGGLRNFVFGPMYHMQYKLRTYETDINILRPAGWQHSGEFAIGISEPIHIGALNKVSGLLMCTATEAMLACICAAFRNYLIYRGVQYPQQFNVSIAFDCKSPDKNAGQEWNLRNKWMYKRMLMPADLNSVLTMLWFQRDIFDTWKRSYNHAVEYNHAKNWSRKLFGITELDKYMSREIDGSTCAFTSFLTPEKDIRIDRSGIERIVPAWRPPKQTPIAITMLTSKKFITITVTADKKIMPDPEVLLYDFTQHVGTLTDLCAFRKVQSEESKKWEDAIAIDEFNGETLAAFAADHTQLKRIARNERNLWTQFPHWSDTEMYSSLPFNIFEEPVSQITQDEASHLVTRKSA